MSGRSVRKKKQAPAGQSLSGNERHKEHNRHVPRVSIECKARSLSMRNKQVLESFPLHHEKFYCLLGAFLAAESGQFLGRASTSQNLIVAVWMQP
jgi:hypothetical protein